MLREVKGNGNSINNTSGCFCTSARCIYGGYIPRNLCGYFLVVRRACEAVEQEEKEVMPFIYRMDKKERILYVLCGVFLPLVIFGYAVFCASVISNFAC